jgi:hypothetical protein
MPEMNEKVSQFRSEVNAELKDINTKLTKHIHKVGQVIEDLGSGKASFHLGMFKVLNVSHAKYMLKRYQVEQ